MNILVSACLMGDLVRYDGKSQKNDFILSLEKEHTLIKVCPETFSGLPTPRKPSEIINDEVFMNDGTNVTKYFNDGVSQSIELLKKYDCKMAILKSKSPSCGKGIIYDGTFKGTFTEGDGMLTRALNKLNIPIFTEEEIDEIKEFLK